jgi:dolichol-phosphate mannosyltransferase
MPIDLTIIIPTRDEEANICELLRQIEVATGGLSAEVIVVDDSDDDTEVRARSAAAVSTMPIRVVHRNTEDRWGGLGGAVCDGLSAAVGQWAVVMDGDLQHPPAVIPALYRRAQESGADMVVASRYVEGGNADGLAGAFRRRVSLVSVLMTRAMFPRRLRHCSDPMSGFFLLRRTAVDTDTLTPRGYKILLEILVRHRLDVAEVPFQFADRTAGTSKAGAVEGMRFLRQLGGLRLAPGASRPTRIIDLRDRVAVVEEESVVSR